MSVLDMLFAAAGSRSTQITYVGAGTTATAASNSIGVPTGVQSGDLLLIILTSGSNHTLTTSTGWTQLVAHPTSGGARVAVWWKIAGSSESSNSVTSTQSRMRGVMLAYRSVNQTSPVDVSQTNTSTGSSTSASTATLTTTVANDLILGLATTSSAASYTAPGSVNSRYNVACDGSVNGLIIWDEIQSSVGTTTSRTATLSGSTTWYTYTAAFDPA